MVGSLTPQCTSTARRKSKVKSQKSKRRQYRLCNDLEWLVHLRRSVLVIDHRFPMERWGKSEAPHLTSMSETEIRKKFQLLKKDASGNHNLLKSRSCERCIKTGKRGTPFGIKFWYQSGEDWPSQHQRGDEAEEGCIGCGWYDFETWRNALNQKLSQVDENEVN